MRRIALILILLAGCSSSASQKENATCAYFYNTVQPLVLTSMERGNLIPAYQAAIDQPAFTEEVSQQQLAVALRMADTADREDPEGFIAATADMGHVCPTR